MAKSKKPKADDDTVVTWTRLPRKVRAGLVRLQAIENRSSMANMIAHCCKTYINEHGAKE